MVERIEELLSVADPLPFAMTAPVYANVAPTLHDGQICTSVPDQIAMSLVSHDGSALELETPTPVPVTETVAPSYIKESHETYAVAGLYGSTTTAYAVSSRKSSNDCGATPKKEKFPETKATESRNERIFLIFTGFIWNDEK